MIVITEITIAIAVCFLVTLMVLGVPFETAMSALLTVLFAAFALVFYSWRKGVVDAKAEVRLAVIGRRAFISRKKLDRTNPSLSNFFISNSKNGPRQITTFFVVFLGFWGFLTTLSVGSLGVVQVFSTDFGESTAPVITFTGQPPGKMPSPMTEVGFTLFTLYWGLPFLVFIILPSRFLSLGDLRKIKEHNIVSTVPRTSFEILSGLSGIGSFALFFFRDVVTNPIALQSAVNNSLFYTLMVGVPIAIFSLYLVYEFEPKIRKQFKDYLIDELGLKVASIKNPTL